MEKIRKNDVFAYKSDNGKLIRKKSGELFLMVALDDELEGDVCVELAGRLETLDARKCVKIFNADTMRKLQEKPNLY
ncbi:MAG: hypothetical protein UX75_C0036G0029 [Candidatus Moranbacteria bacterium GW2011_GWE2_47_10]|nr:MAG: hypothetical protein UX75_C0036G0029 [Candidatus Moranbacteria bacterium GW2011_GWE2_47_10]